ncbi:MAG: Oar protein, partial [Betaproteobacteria bacterium]|nr:Oar protein [Betaproteobacteria bacterium]
MRNTPSDVFVRAAFALAVAAITTHATAQNTSAALSGSVTGSDGRPVSGATVSITHKESGTTTKVLTDGSGRFSARGLRVGGPYLMTAEKEGVVERKDDIYLSLAETASFSFSIGQSQSVTVTASTGYDVFQNRAMGAGTQLSAIEVASLPTVQRSIQDVARLDPRFAFTDRERGEISMAGMNPRYNSYTVDGLSIADSFGLEGNQLPMLKQPVPMDAIQNVQINASNYDVSQKGYVGANVNAVTKSGTNEVKGSVYYGFRDQGLTGERYNRTNDTYFATPPFKESFKGFTLGGPLITDKLFFFVAYDEFASSRSIPDFGPVGSSKTNVGITQDAIDQVVSLAKSKYGLNLGSISASPGNAELKDMLLKLDWSIADGHRASLRYSRTEQVEPLPQNFFSSNTGSGLGLSSDWYIQNKKLDSIVGQWFADWSAVFSTEVKASKRNYDSVPTPFEGGRMPYMQFQFQGALPAGLPAGFSTVQRTLYAGTERSRHTNVLKTDTSDVYAAGNYLAGEHEIKFGADWADNKIYNAFLQDTIGNYTFRCENGNYSFGAVTCSSASADTVLRAMLENFQNGRPSGYSTQVAFPGRTLDDAIAQWSYQNTGAFIQDTWRPMPRLELMAGVRIDSLGVSQSPLANKAALTAFGYDNTTTLDGKKLFQPRLGFNWDLSQSAQKMQLRGGWGLFQGTAPTVWLSNPFSNTGMASGIVNCTSASA